MTEFPLGISPTDSGNMSGKYAAVGQQESSANDDDPEGPAGPPLKTFDPSLAECKQIALLAYPMAAGTLLEQVSRQATSMLVGHIGPLYLGAATMGLSEFHAHMHFARFVGFKVMNCACCSVRQRDWLLSLLRR